MAATGTTVSRWVVLLAAGLLLGACGGDGDDGGDGDPSPAPDAPTEALLTIQNMAFSPANLAVRPGQTVRVRNLDAMEHSVTSQSAPNTFTPGAVAGVSFDTGIFGRGDRTFVIPASAPVGTLISYFCRVHPGTMANTGVLTVRAAGDSSPVPPDPPPGY
jgi:plastocyanin